MTLPAKATSSTAGQIMLNGDLVGSADVPELRKSGVVADTYSLVIKSSIDSKGRFTSAGAASQTGSTFDTHFAPLIGTATSSTKGVFSVDPNGGLAISSGVLSIPSATSSVKGIVQIGTSGLAISSGQLTLDPTTIQQAGTSQRGVFQLGTNFTKVGTALTFVANPTGSVLGTYFVGSGLSKFGNFLTRTLAESAVLGIAFPELTGINITVSAGALNVGSNVSKLATAQTFTKSQVTQKYAASASSSFTPDFSLSDCIEVTLTGNITLNAPTNTVDGGVYTLILIQDGTGGRTVSRSGSYRGPAFTASTAANAIDVITIIATDGNYLFILSDRF